MHSLGHHSGSGFCSRRQDRGAALLSANISTNKYHIFPDPRELSLPITQVPTVTSRLGIHGMQQNDKP